MCNPHPLPFPLTSQSLPAKSNCMSGQGILQRPAVRRGLILMGRLARCPKAFQGWALVLVPGRSCPGPFPRSLFIRHTHTHPMSICTSVHHPFGQSCDFTTKARIAYFSAAFLVPGRLSRRRESHVEIADKSTAQVVGVGPEKTSQDPGRRPA